MTQGAGLQEIDKIEEERHEVNTKLNPVWAMTVFEDWLIEKKMSTDFDFAADSLLLRMYFH